MKVAVKDELIRTLNYRFDKNMVRHKGIDWNAVLANIEADPRKLETLYEMERTGGDPWDFQVNSHST